MFKIKAKKIQVIRLSFQDNELTDHQGKYSLNPELGANVGKLDENHYFTQLSVRVKNEKDQAFPIDVDVAVRAVFEVAAVEDEQALEGFLKKQGVHILFPYLRSTLSGLTSLAMVPPIVLPIIDASKLFDKINKSEKEDEEQQD